HSFRLHHSLVVPCAGIDHMDFSADGRYALASCEFSGQLVKVNIQRERVVGALNLPDGRAGMPQDVKLSPDGRIFYVADLQAGCSPRFRSAPARTDSASGRSRAATPSATQASSAEMTYLPAGERYERMPYRRSGRSGLQLPAVSLGLWQNFGGDWPLETSRAIVRRAFDLGITHFDLANNYGPPYGSAETNFGLLMKQDLAPYRDELIVSSKAGYDMWPGPYGDWGSRKYLLASLDQSLQRMAVDY